MKKNTARKPQPVVDSKTRILLVDDHPILREGVSQRINRESDMVVAAEANDAHTALELVRTGKLDIAVVDIALEGSNGVELIKDLKVRYPVLPVIVLSMHDESLYAERALKAGARGYVMKNEDPSVLVQAIRQVLNGKVHLSERVTTKILNRMAGEQSPEVASPLDLLSDRELQVFDLIGQGFGTSEISARLHLSVKTVATHRENIKRKLKLTAVNELVRFAIPWVRDRAARA
jgi:DNA-binding NarL/FixJ family response regulator